ncbi:MAG: hypothetical protein ACRD17_07310 [Terriglobales bacterium]
MNAPDPDHENLAPLEDALRAALDPAATPVLDAGFATRVAARATAPSAQRRPAWRWYWAAAIGVILAGIFTAGLWRRPAPAAAPSAVARAEQVRQLRYAVAFTRAEIADITGAAVRPSLQNLANQIERNQP